MTDLNSIAAKMMFLGSTIQKLNVRNTFARVPDDAKFLLDVRVGVGSIRHTKVGNSESEVFAGQCDLQVTVKIDPERLSDDQVLEFQILLSGSFAASPDASDLTREQFINMLRLNGTTCLFSIARAKLEVISALTLRDGKIEIPMLNIAQSIQGTTFTE